MKILRITMLTLSLTALLASCGPKKGTIEDKEAVKNDSLNVREGQGEGPVGESDHK
ncbi:hypothetical protein [Fulvivirga aurantia]|uniref:hypothetical protein n=1 Tax=Fulvivirga aurantia TaxID=2529383 RepID=UPI0012BB9E36|nr:hypothetical protein [Fulvivirga aurantia]